MAKGILEFDIDDPHERTAHLRAVKATDAYLALHDLNEKLRQWSKDEEKEEIKIETLRTEFFEILENRGINLDDLE